MLLRQCTSSLYRQFLKRTFARQDLSVREHPRRITVDILVLANLKLSLPVGGRTFDIWQEPGRGAKHRFGRLAMRAPESSIENSALVLKACRERVEFPRPRFYEDGRADAGHDQSDD